MIITLIKTAKKGEILVNNIIIGYKNSKNTFTVSNSNTKQAISSAINNDSGVTARFSNNLYKNIKGNYLSVGTTLDIFKIIANEYVSDTSEGNHSLQIKIWVTLGVFALAWVAVMVLLCFYLFRKHGESSKTKKILFILTAILGLIAMGISNYWIISNELNINSDKIEKIKNLKKQWDKPAEGSDKFFQKISDDQKYFISTSGETDEKCQEEFNNLSISKVKEKKWFYEQCKNKPADYEENPDKYKDTPYGMFKNSMKKFDEVNNILVDVSWRFNKVIIIDLVVLALISLCLISAIRSYNKNVELNRQLNMNIEVVESGLKSHGTIKNNEYVNGEQLQKAIDSKDIIIRDTNDFNDIIIGNDPEQYGKIYEPNDFLGNNKRWFCIKNSYWNAFKKFLIFTF